MISGWSISASHEDGNRTLDLICDGFKWTDKKENKRISFVRSLDTKPSVFGDDYQYLLDIRNGSNRCDLLKVRFQKDDFDETYKINVNKIDWDHDKKMASFKLESDSVFASIDDNSKEEYNILDTAIKHTSRVIVGEVKTVTITEFKILTHFEGNRLLDAPDPPAGLAWGVKNFTAAYEEREGEILDEETSVTVTYAREEYTGTAPPTGGGWLNESGNLWVRECSFVEVSAITFFDPVNVDPNDQDQGYVDGGTYTYTVVREVLGSEGFEFSNGVKFRDVLVYILGALGYQVNSRYFNTGNTASNANHLQVVYDWSDVYLSELLMYQKSDIKRPDADNDATIGILKYSQLFEILDLFQAEYKVEDSTTNPITLRLEHESYFNNNTHGIDLTTDRFSKQIKDLNQLSGEATEIPRTESFDWMERTTREFDGVPIKYPANCATTEPDEKRFSFITNDITRLCSENNDDFSDQGFTLVSVTVHDGNNIIATQVNPLTGRTIINNVMGFPVLHEKIYRHARRPYSSGTINEGRYDLVRSHNTLKRTIEITGFTLNEYHGFDPTLPVLDNVGFGNVSATVEEANYDESSCTLTLQLSYP